MATKIFCDRCGAEINPLNRMTYISVKSAGYAYAIDYELCVSCAHELRKWLSREEGEDEAAD